MPDVTYSASAAPDGVSLPLTKRPLLGRVLLLLKTMREAAVALVLLIGIEPKPPQLDALVGPKQR